MNRKTLESNEKGIEEAKKVIGQETEKNKILSFKKLLWQVSFIKSASTLAQCPLDEGFEFAFVGRSNVGKSTAINTICNSKKIAKTSKTPGRTQLINFFALDEAIRLVDLPGYGYAKVSKSVQQAWQKNLGEYLENRKSLKALIILVDSRHSPKELDLNMINWSGSNLKNTLVLLTKIDRSGQGQANKTKMELIRNTDLQKEDVILFSALNKVGVEKAIQTITGWVS